VARCPTFSYVLVCCADRMFTTGEVGVQASQHLPSTDYSAVVQKALELPGFSHEPEPKFVTVGFGHQTTLGAAGRVHRAP
jgi:hydroxylamine reductase